jgi:hypothetical protein
MLFISYSGCVILGCNHLQATYVIKVQLLEIYNEQLRDLLDDRNRGKKLDIRSTERSGLNVPDAIQVMQGGPTLYTSHMVVIVHLVSGMETCNY